MTENIIKNNKILELIENLKNCYEELSEYSKFVESEELSKNICLDLYKDFFNDIRNLKEKAENEAKEMSDKNLISTDELKIMINYYSEMSEFSAKINMNKKQKEIYVKLYKEYSMDLTILKSAIEQVVDQ